FQAFFIKFLIYFVKPHELKPILMFSMSPNVCRLSTKKKKKQSGFMVMCPIIPLFEHCNGGPAATSRQVLSF
ncbi:hypothetical protein BLOT_012277, partial [Blomia tropicalis]